MIDDAEIIKKILKHLSLWDVKHKPPARANGPPTESFIIYDESSSPSADDYLIDADYPIESYLKKNPATGTAVSYARIDINLQPRRNKLILTIKPAWVMWMVNVGI